MKALKIGLVLVVIAAIAFYYMSSIDEPVNLIEVSETENIHIKRIEDHIKKIKELPENKFNKSIYTEGISLIDHLSKPAPPTNPYGRLGETQTDNDNRKATLTSNLYAAYVQKFIDQAFYVYNGNVWNQDDLTFIKNESRTLNKSPYLKRDSPVYDRLSEIQLILNKYDEINLFIFECNQFEPKTNPKGEVASEFPINDIIDKINQVKVYKSFYLGNRYVNNCSRLNTALNEIPNILFQKHYTFLNKKIDYWSDIYKDYGTLKAYRDNIYTPINNQINLMNSNVYEVADFYEKRDILITKWNKDATSAYNYHSTK